MYNVVLRCTHETGDSEGIITWTTFASKKEFQRVFTSERKKFQEVIAEGVSEERCIELSDQTTLKSQFRRILNKSTEPNSLESRHFRLSNSLKNLILLRLVDPLAS